MFTDTVDRDSLILRFMTIVMHPMSMFVIGAL